jgi:hypothetical protein
VESLSSHWSILVHVSSALVIAAYFALRALSVRRPELHAWAIAWLANLVALLVGLGFPQLPSNSALFALVSALYFFAKTQFVVLLVAGASGFTVEPARPAHGRSSLAIAALSALAGMVVGSLDRVGLVQSVTIGAILLAGAIAVSRQNAPAWRWLASGFVLRAMLAATETAGYAFHAAFPERPYPGPFGSFMPAHATFDAAAECVIALGCAFMLNGKLRREEIRQSPSGFSNETTTES